jgi:hypothetical protein
MPTKEEVRQMIIDFGKDKKAAWLATARKHAYSIALARGEVCADDIHAVCPIPENDVDPRIMGSVFRGMEFVRFQKSKRSECHHRGIGVFRLPLDKQKQ